MSDTPTPPEPGQPLWGDDLNTYLLSLEARIAANETTVSEVTQLTGELDGRVTAVENTPEYFFNSYPWQYSNQEPPPTGNQVRFDNADLSQATQAVFRLLDSDGADRTQVFRMLDVGSQFRISDWDDVAKLHRFNVTGPSNIGASDVTVPVEWVSGSGAIPNAKVNVAFVVALVM